MAVSRDTGVIPRWLRWSVQWALTIGVTWFIVHRVGVTLDEAASLDAAVPDPATGVLLLSAVLLLGAFLLSARLWARMVGELGGVEPGFGSAARIVLASNLGRYVPGKVWQVTGLAILSKRAGLSGTVAAAAGVIGQAFSLAAAGVLAVPAFVGTGQELEMAALALLLALVGLVAVVSVPAVLHMVMGRAFRLARVPQERVPSIRWTFGPRWLCMYLVNWGLYALAFVVFMRGLGFHGGSMLAVAPAFAAAYLLGYVALFAPAGLGVREGFLIAFLRPEFGAAAVGIAIFTRVWMTVVELLPAGGLALWEIFRNGEGNAVSDDVISGGERT